MRSNLLAAFAVAATVVCVAPASAAVFPVGTNTATASFIATPGPNGTFSGAIARSGIAAGVFTDSFTFTLPLSGLGTGSVITTSGLLGVSPDLNFTSVTFNGKALPIDVTFGGLIEMAAGTGLPVTAGVLNTLNITGTSFGGASYGGNLTFNPTAAVPEVATWAMMLMGFGMMGAGLRYSRRSSKVAYA